MNATQQAPEVTSKRCPRCRGTVSSDQSYCLNCGARQPGGRAPYVSPPGGEGADPPASDGPPPAKDWTPAVALGGLAMLAVVLVVGVLIGRSGQTTATKAAATPQVVTVAGGGGGSAPSSTGSGASKGSGTPVASISEDWPAGKSGYTVRLQTVPKSGATAASVGAAKSAASSKGAPKVGVLDASNYNSLGGDYIIYSGVYDTQAQASAALSKLKKPFPGAKVIHVVPNGGQGGGVVSGTPPSAAQQAAGAATIQSLNNCSGAACSKAARKITQPIATPGTAPPKDNKPAGGGSQAQTFQ